MARSYQIDSRIIHPTTPGIQLCSSISILEAPLPFKWGLASDVLGSQGCFWGVFSEINNPKCFLQSQFIQGVASDGVNSHAARKPDRKKENPDRIDC